MNTQQLLQARAGYADDATFLAWANATTTTYTPETWVRWTTVANALGTAVADQVYALLLSISPAQAAAFINPGFDVGAEYTRSQMAQIAVAYPQAAPVVSWCQAQAAVNVPNCAAFGMTTLTQADLDACRLRAAKDNLLAAMADAYNQKCTEIEEMSGDVPTKATIALS